MKKLKIFAVALLLICALCVLPAAADSGFITLPDNIIDTSNVNFEWSPVTDEHFSKAYNNGTFDLWNFMTGSVVSPFSKIMGDWLPLIVFFLFFVSIFLKNGISYMTIMLGLIGAIWYSFLPVSAIPMVLLLFVLGLTAILYRLYKNRR